MVEGIERDTDDFVSQNFNVFVENTPGGTSTRVASFSPTNSVPAEMSPDGTPF